MTCILHTGCTDKRGYGQVKYKGRVQFAHRVALAKSLGVEPWDLGGDILHSCDTPLCCNPAHLRVGTEVDNMADAIARGRIHHKITAALAAEIKSKFIRTSPRKSNTDALALEYGVHRSTITNVLNGTHKIYG